MAVEFQNDDVVKTVSLDYHAGTREPHLEREAGKADVLAQILAPRANDNPYLLDHVFVCALASLADSLGSPRHRSGCVVPRDRRQDCQPSVDPAG
jgi:hypothetical protein